MRCPKPIGLIDPKTKMARVVPCGQCVICRINKALDWTFRLLVEKHDNPDCSFLTLTYDDEHLPPYKSLCLKDLQDFWKRLRASGYPLRYFACGEYGSLLSRPHYHAIVFKISVDMFVDLGHLRYDSRHMGYYGMIPQWSYGEIFVGDVSKQSIAYCCKYTLKALRGKDAEKTYDATHRERPFSVQSRRPGIGSNIEYALSQNPRRVKEKDNYFPPLPRYYREKAFPKGSLKREFIDFINFCHRMDLYTDLSNEAQKLGVTVEELSQQVIRDYSSKMELFDDRSFG